MKSIHEFSEIYLHRASVDGRKAINGLSAIIHAEMNRLPFHGGLFVFTNRRRDMVRILYWDRSGYALWMKRLEEEKFRWPLKSKEEVITISSVELSWLLDGLDITQMKPHQTLSYCADALPLYRQKSIFARSGIDLPRSTLASWMIKCGQLVRPLINLAKDELLISRVILADETRYQILKRGGKKATSQSYVWVFMKDEPGKPKVIIYEVGPSRSHTVPLEFLDGYSGYLHTDGYEAYEALATRAPGIILVGDWVHVCRKFDEAVKAHGKLPGKPKADEGLQLINELFKIERDIVLLSAEERLKIRQDKSRNITEKVLTWAQDTISSVPPKSLTGKALSYMLERWPKLLHFLNDSVIRLDTNPVENAIRPFAIGRKNWMFSDSMAGAESSAALYSLICMARAAELNPFEYFKAVFEHLPKAKTADEVTALLPWNWQAPSKPVVQ